jgi:hypothetical protein
MGYNVIDLIDKVKKIANRKRTIYESLGQKKCDIYDITSIEIMSRVIAKEMENTVKYYEELKNEVSENKIEEIDFFTYNKMSFLIDEYNKNIFVTDINNIKEYLKLSLDLEKDGKSVLIDVQGRFVQKTSDTQTKTYKVLSYMIINKENLISRLEKSIK